MPLTGTLRSKRVKRVNTTQKSRPRRVSRKQQIRLQYPKTGGRGFPFSNIFSRKNTQAPSGTSDRIDKLNEEINGLKNEIGTLKSKTPDLIETTGILTTETQVLRSKIEALNLKIDNLNKTMNKKIDKLESSELFATGHTIRTLQESLDKLEQRLGVLETNVPVVPLTKPDSTSWWS